MVSIPFAYNHISIPVSYFLFHSQVIVTSDPRPPTKLSSAPLHMHIPTHFASTLQCLYPDCRAKSKDLTQPWNPCSLVHVCLSTPATITPLHNPWSCLWEDSQFHIPDPSHFAHFLYWLGPSSLFFFFFLGIWILSVFQNPVEITFSLWSFPELSTSWRALSLPCIVHCLV